MQKKKNKTSGRPVVSEVRNSNWDAFNASSILNLNHSLLSVSFGPSEEGKSVASKNIHLSLSPIDLGWIVRLNI